MEQFKQFRDLPMELNHSQLNNVPQALQQPIFQDYVEEHNVVMEDIQDEVLNSVIHFTSQSIQTTRRSLGKRKRCVKHVAKAGKRMKLLHLEAVIPMEVLSSSKGLNAEEEKSSAYDKLRITYDQLSIAYDQLNQQLISTRKQLKALKDHCLLCGGPCSLGIHTVEVDRLMKLDKKELKAVLITYRLKQV